MSDTTYHVYIMTNKWNTVLYTGMSGQTEQRADEHRQKIVPSFTARYYIHKVVYAAAFETATEAAEAEWRIKGWTRKKKIALIESMNPTWKDLILEDDTLRSLIKREGVVSPRPRGVSSSSHVNG